MTTRYRYGDAIAAIVLVLPFCLSALVWIYRDWRVWPWDQAWYGEVAVDLWVTSQQGFDAWLTAMLKALGSKPPLLSWVGQAFVPLGSMVDRVEASLLLVNVTASATTLVLCYAIVRRLGGSVFDGILGSLLCGGSALFIGVTTQFLVEPLQALVVTYALFVAVSAESRSWLSLVFQIVILACLCLLVKVTTFLFVAPTAAWLFVTLLRDRLSENGTKRPPGRTELSRGGTWWTGARSALLAAATLVTLSATVLWYWTNVRKVVHHAVAAAVSETALLYGSQGPLFQKLGFWVRALAEAISPVPLLLPLVAAVFIAAMVSVLARSASGRRSPRQDLSQTLLVLAIALTVILTLMAYSLQINEETRFLYPVIPLVAILVGWSSAVLSSRLIRVPLAIALAANALIVHAVAQGYTSPQLSVSPWLKAPHTDGGAFADLQSSVRESCRPQNGGRYQIVGVELPHLNANSAAFFSAKGRISQGHRCYYTSLGYAEKDVETAIKRVFALDADHVLTLDARGFSANADPFNLVSLPVAEWLRNGAPFDLAAEKGNVVIYRRRR